MKVLSSIMRASNKMSHEKRKGVRKLYKLPRDEARKMSLTKQLDTARVFCAWLIDHAMDNILDGKTESFNDMLYTYAVSLENDYWDVNKETTDDVTDVIKFLYNLFKEECYL